MSARPSRIDAVDPPPRRRTRVLYGSVTVERHLFDSPVPFAAHWRQPEPVTAIHIVTSGTVTVTVPDGSATEVRTGDAFVLSDALVGSVVSAGGATTVSATLPSALLHSAMSSDRLLLVDGVSSQLIAPIRAFMLSALEPAESESSVAHYYLERLLQEMIVGLLVDAHRSVGAPTAPETFALALAIIAAQRTDPDLTAAGLARDVHLSPRQLQRVFQSRGTTVEREIRREKIEHALELLRTRDYDELSIGEIARHSGFSTGSSLARAMAATGHPSPAEVRRRSAEQYRMRRD